ncbi:hypothetical protein [Streptomyces pratensis]|uniref:hypothetical protein n=1 Tax=Streptomyces pratensis TaxID=1169025 RepID=UPI003015E7AD
MTKRGIMRQDGPRAQPGFRGINRATRGAGALLCWAHAIALILTAAEALHRSTAGWWAASWALTAGLFLAWAALRAAQKRLLRRTADPEDGGSDPTFPEGPTDYDRAA